VVSFRGFSLSSEGVKIVGFGGSRVCVVGGRGGTGGGGSKKFPFSFSSNDGDDADERSWGGRFFSVPLGVGEEMLVRGRDDEGARRRVLKSLVPNPGDAGEGMLEGTEEGCCSDELESAVPLVGFIVSCGFSGTTR